MSRQYSAAAARPDKIKNLRYLLTRDRVLRIAEHAVGGWARTLRAAFLMIAIFIAFVVIVGIVLGFGGALVGAVLSGVSLYLVGRPTTPAR